MCDRREPCWPTSCEGASTRSNRMSEFFQGMLTGVAVAVAAIALGIWLLKQ